MVYQKALSTLRQTINNISLASRVTPPAHTVFKWTPFSAGDEFQTFVSEINKCSTRLENFLASSSSDVNGFPIDVPCNPLLGFYTCMYLQMELYLNSLPYLFIIDFCKTYNANKKPFFHNRWKSVFKERNYLESGLVCRNKWTKGV